MVNGMTLMANEYITVVEKHGHSNDFRLKPCPHWRLSPKPATVTEFGNSRRFWRQIVAESATIVSSVDRLLEVISACISSEPGLIWTNMQKDGRPGKGAAI